MSEKTEDADITAFTKEERRNGWLMGGLGFVFGGLFLGGIVSGVVNVVLYLLVFQWFNLPEVVVFTTFMWIDIPIMVIDIPIMVIDIPIMVGVGIWCGLALGKLRMRKERERRLQGNAGIEKA